jgi:hypothetical protein
MPRKMKSNKSGIVDEKPPEQPAVRDYTVGYGRPPLSSRFKRGVSGNLRGRPKGHKNLKTLLKQVMTAQISVREGSRSTKVSKLVAVVLRQLQTALKGNDRSAMVVIKMATQLGLLEESDSSAGTMGLSESDEQIVQELLTRRRRRQR